MMARPVVLPPLLLLLLPLALLALQRQHGAAAFLLPLGTAGQGQGSIKQHQHQQWPGHGRVHVVTWSSTADVDASEFARRELERKQKEYEASLQARMQEQVQDLQQQDGGPHAAPPLASLPVVPYLDAEGKISTAGADAKVKASVYAVLDAEGAVRYIGVSRSVAQSLRLHLARMPEQTYGFKVFHIARPSRAILEMTRQAWIQELGAPPEGNDNGPNQALWENALDVKPLMTADDHALIEDAKTKQKSEENAMKKIARRFEAAKVAVLEARGVTENLRFDPKLKAKGLLDLYVDKQPDLAVPETAKPGAGGGPK